MAHGLSGQSSWWKLPLQLQCCKSWGFATCVVWEGMRTPVWSPLGPLAFGLLQNFSVVMSYLSLDGNGFRRPSSKDVIMGCLTRHRWHAHRSCVWSPVLLLCTPVATDDKLPWKVPSSLSEYFYDLLRINTFSKTLGRPEDALVRIDINPHPGAQSISKPPEHSLQVLRPAVDKWSIKCPSWKMSEVSKCLCVSKVFFDYVWIRKPFNAESISFEAFISDS